MTRYLGVSDGNWHKVIWTLRLLFLLLLFLVCILLTLNTLTDFPFFLQAFWGCNWNTKAGAPSFIQYGLCLTFKVRLHRTRVNSVQFDQWKSFQDNTLEYSIEALNTLSSQNQQRLKTNLLITARNFSPISFWSLTKKTHLPQIKAFLNNK